MKATVSAASDNGTGKPTLFILTNMLSPYRMPLYEGLSKSFNLTLVVGKAETNRPEWGNLSSGLDKHGIKLLEAKGRSIRLAPDKFVHVNPGYLSLLFSLRPDAVISLEMGFRSMCALTYSRFLNKPLWIWSGGTPLSEKHTSRLKRMTRAIFAKSKARWVSYGALASEYLNSIGVKSDRIAQIQNSVDERLFSPTGKRFDYAGARPVLLVVGQLIDRKGIQQLFESASRVSQRGYSFSLKLVGSGHRRQALEAVVAELGLTNVEFLGGVSPEVMPSYYRGADVLVFPTLEDIWGLVVNEAMLCGLPVVSSCYAGCVSELLNPQDVFDPLDAEKFDEAMIRAIGGQASAPDLSRLWGMRKVVEVIRSDVMSQLTVGAKG